MQYAALAASLYGAKKQSDAADEATSLSKSSTAWQQAMQEYLLNRSGESASNWEADIENELSWEDAQNQAESQLNQLYSNQTANTLQNVANSNKARGFYGQLEGDRLEQGAAANVASARTSAVASLANQLTEANKNRILQQKLGGIGSFGQYGDVSSYS